MSCLCCVPAVAMTVAPKAFAIWTAARPTPPAAAWTRTQSPDLLCKHTFSWSTVGRPSWQEAHTLFDTGPDYQASVARRRSDKHACCISKPPTIRHTLEAFFSTRDVCCVSALAGPKDLIANFELWCFPTRQRRGGFEYNAREFGTRNPREWRLVLIFAANLEEVEEVCG
jgi:hypothetical protein